MKNCTPHPFEPADIPDRAVDLDPVALRAMRWAMHSWERVKFLNTWMKS